MSSLRHRTVPGVISPTVSLPTKHNMCDKQLPCQRVEVLYWNAYYVHIRCLYCEEIHRHGVSLPGTRASDCYPGGQYEYMFPIDEASKLVGYELDKRKACFVNFSLQNELGDTGLQSLEKDDCDLTDSFRSAINISTGKQGSDSVLNLYTDSQKVEIVTLPNDERLSKRVCCSLFQSVCSAICVQSSNISILRLKQNCFCTAGMRLETQH